MNEIARKTTPGVMAISEAEIMAVMRNSLYPGARDESIKMVLAYCRAAGLDPLQKPVHIVPMSVKVAGPQGGKDTYEWRDVVMPGIGLYRIQAADTREYAGMSEPEFGPDVAETLEGVEITYPKWCKVTVRRLINDRIAEFSATEYWKENYATTGRDSVAPNTMWKKRPYAQLAKCAEAQALRKGFPSVGAQPTADEMEGKTIFEGGITIDGTTGEVINKPPSGKPVVQPPQRKSEAAAVPVAATGNKITEPQRKMIWAKANAKGLREEALKEMLGVEHLRDIAKDELDAVLKLLDAWTPTCTA